MHEDLKSLALLLAQAERQRYEALAEQLKAETAKRAATAQAEQLVRLPAANTSNAGRLSSAARARSSWSAATRDSCSA